MVRPRTCHARISLNIAHPAGAGAVVAILIHSGSSSSVGMRSRERWVPTIWRVAPLLRVWAMGEPSTNSIGSVDSGKTQQSRRVSAGLFAC